MLDKHILCLGISMGKQLEEKYTTSSLMHLLRTRYGLNQLGIQTLLDINKNTYKAYLNGRVPISMKSHLKLVNAFDELAGKIEVKEEK